MCAFVAPVFSTLRARRACSHAAPLTRRIRVVRRASRSARLRTCAALEPLVLSEEAVQLALEEVVVKLGSVFGNSPENRDVGITGEVELASLDGPIVVLRLQGRFWHKRADVVRAALLAIPIDRR